ncbi:unnamed protein product [Menidia menidia]|uniref:(Atlantic silverside) hypothetical protein n=1 Tax=Menidia menidia TaxID=238744 RepID=A0A8S4AKU6_9TELE|nr:unnamed protein product [Menidia menidia]
MNNFWRAAIILCAVIAASHCLTCRKCPIGIFGSCLISSEVTCNNATESCYFGDAQFNATGAVKLHTRGCVDKDVCNKTLTGMLFTAGITTTFKCCETTLCNGATAVQLPLTLALCAAIMSSLFGFWEL